MDQTAAPFLRQFFARYKYILLIFLAGIVLMLFPTADSKKTEQQPTHVQEQAETVRLEEQLSELLSQLAGAGKVQVLLTEATGQQTVYQENRDISQQSESTKTSTVILSDSTREQEGLVCQVNPPTYLGAVVLCQGADLPSVRLSITEAVSNATGLGYHKITVLKMK